MPIAIIVHGGAGNRTQKRLADYRAGCETAASAGWQILAQGGSSLDAVEAAVRSMEDDPAFDAGRGAYLNADGRIELDAAIMDGCELRAGAVAAVSRVANPVTLARRVMEHNDHLFLVGEGAESFGARLGVPMIGPEVLVVPRERAAWEKRRAEDTPAARLAPVAPGDTVGALALDSSGSLAGAGSTGGTFFKQPGRVGDTPLIGCGLYVDNLAGAVACTGYGEHIIRAVLAYECCRLLRAIGNAQAAADAAMAYFTSKVAGQGGLICLNPRGEVGFARTTSHMTCSWRTDSDNRLRSTN